MPRFILSGAPNIKSLVIRPGFFYLRLTQNLVGLQGHAPVRHGIMSESGFDAARLVFDDAQWGAACHANQNHSCCMSHG